MYGCMVQIMGWSVIRNIDDLMRIYIFLSRTLHEGRKFTINTTKFCLFRRLDLQPELNAFLVKLGRKFVPSSNSYHLWELCVVLKLKLRVLLVCCFPRYSISSSQISGSDRFLKKAIQGSLHLICIINRLQKRATCKRK